MKTTRFFLTILFLLILALLSCNKVVRVVSKDTGVETVFDKSNMIGKNTFERHVKIIGINKMEVLKQFKQVYFINADENVENMFITCGKGTMTYDEPPKGDKNFYTNYYYDVADKKEKLLSDIEWPIKEVIFKNNSAILVSDNVEKSIFEIFKYEYLNNECRRISSISKNILGIDYRILKFDEKDNTCVFAHEDWGGNFQTYSYDLKSKKIEIIENFNEEKRKESVSNYILWANKDFRGAIIDKEGNVLAKNVYMNNGRWVNYGFYSFLAIDKDAKSKLDGVISNIYIYNVLTKDLYMLEPGIDSQPFPEPVYFSFEKKKIVGKIELNSYDLISYPMIIDLN